MLPRHAALQNRNSCAALLLSCHSRKKPGIIHKKPLEPFFGISISPIFLNQILEVASSINQMFHLKYHPYYSIQYLLRYDISRISLQDFFTDRSGILFWNWMIVIGKNRYFLVIGLQSQYERELVLKEWNFNGHLESYFDLYLRKQYLGQKYVKGVAFFT